MNREIIKTINSYRRSTPHELTPLEASYSVNNESIHTYVCVGCYKPFKANSRYITDNNILHCKECIASIEKASPISSHRHYHRWRAIVSRCTNPKDKRYSEYGGRGINLYEPWITDGRAFIEYIESLPNADKVDESYTLDRIDNSKGYVPNNLRWESKQVQVLNQRLLKKSNSTGYSGVTKHVLNINGKRVLANPNKPYTARVRVGNGKRINLGYYKTELEAVKARDRYILENELTHHKTQVIHKL